MFSPGFYIGYNVLGVKYNRVDLPHRLIELLYSKAEINLYYFKHLERIVSCRAEIVYTRFVDVFHIYVKLRDCDYEEILRQIAARE